MYTPYRSERSSRFHITWNPTDYPCLQGPGNQSSFMNALMVGTTRFLLNNFYVQLQKKKHP